MTLEDAQRAVVDPVICYVLVRIDAPDFCLGKACAQTHHNGTEMTEDLHEKDFPALNALYEEWKLDADAELAAAMAVAQLKQAKTDEEPVELITALQTAVIETREAADKLKRKFGTVLTLAVTAAQMRQAAALAPLLNLHAKITHDPTYPIRDGDRYITAPVDSCAYVFARKSEAKPVVGTFDLLHEKHIVR